MNSNASICSVLQKGSEVKISANASHKSPHLNGKVGRVVAMPGKFIIIYY